jgi:diguanylate cyclase (GGDEF)-like protein
MAAGIGIFAQTLLMRAPFRQCAAGLAAALAVFCALALVPWPGHFGPPITKDYLIFLIGFSLPALYERHSREKADRREYLLSESNRLRMEDILRMNLILDRLSSMDALTGVFNRRYLDAALSRLCDVAIARQHWIGVIMIDIDHFKSINDTAGHPHGDYCLQQVALVLQKSVRVGLDTVARFGGEEFIVILPDAAESETFFIGERIRQSIEAAALPAAHGRPLTVSAGATAFRGQAAAKFTAGDMVATADSALYAAKNSGRNRVVYSSPNTPAAPPTLAMADNHG